MSGTDKLYVDGRYADNFTPAKMQSITECPLISTAVAVKAATGYHSLLQIPAGAYVYRVALLATAAVATADLDVGDAAVSDCFIDGVTTLAIGNMVMSGLGGSAVADPVAGKYYSASGTIKLNVKATGSTGTVKVLVWYVVP